MAAALTACGASGWTPESKAVALKRIGLTLPAAATVESAAGAYGGIDDAIRLVATMPAADWARWRPTIHASDGGPVIFRPMFNGDLEGEDGWAPAKTPGLTSTQLHWRVAEALNLGVKPEPGGRVRLFVFWYQT